MVICQYWLIFCGSIFHKIGPQYFHKYYFTIKVDSIYTRWIQFCVTKIKQMPVYTRWIQFGVTKIKQMPVWPFK